MRLIDADAADINKICSYYGGLCDIDEVQKWLDDQPTIEAEPVRHGRWSDKQTVIKYLSHCECSVCGSWQGEYWMKYCPNCGAKMDGGA